MRGQFPCLKFSGLTASSLQTGHIPQPLLEISHNHSTPAEAPDHQIDETSFHHPHVFAVWSADLNVQQNRPLHLIPQREYPSDILQQSLFELTLPSDRPSVEAEKGEIKEAVTADI